MSQKENLNRILNKTGDSDACRQLLSVLETAGDFVAFLSLDGRILHLNQRGCYLLTLSDDESLTQFTYADLVAEDQHDYLHNTILPTVRKKGLWRGNLNLFGQDGMKIPTSQTITTAEDEAGNPAYITVIAQDTTEQTWTEDSLRESELRFRGSFENTSIGMALVSLNGHFLQANSALQRLTGYSEQELLSKTLFDILNKEDLAQNQHLIQQFQTGDLDTLENQVRLITQTGKTRWVRVNIARIEDIHGETAYFIVQLRNITKQMQAEQELLESEHRFRNLAESAPDTIYILDLTTRQTVYINQDEFLGYTRDEFDSPEFVQNTHPDDLPLVTAHWQEVMQGNEGNILEYRVRSKEGEWEWLQSRESILAKDEEGNPTQLLVMLTVITERKQAEEAQREQETRLRLFFENSHDAMLILDEGTFVDCNLSTVRMLRAESKEDLLPLRPGSLSPEYQPDGRLSTEKAEEMVQIALEEGSNQFEWLHKRHNGEDFPVEVTLTAVPYGGKTTVYTVWRDISERKRAEVERDRLINILENTTDFVSIADPEGAVIYMNRAGMEMTGIPLDADLSRLTIPELHPDWAKEIIGNEGIPTAVAASAWQGETAFLHPDGHEIPVSQVIIAHTDTKGDLQFLSTIARDISALRRAEVQTELQLEISQALTNALTEEDVIDTTVTKAAFYPETAVSVFLRQQIGGNWSFIHKQGHVFNSDMGALPDDIQLTANQLPAHFSRDEPFISGNMLEDDRVGKATRRMVRRLGAVSFAAFPLTSGDNWYGHLAVASHTPDFFTHEAIAVYRTLAEQTTTALRAAHLLHETQESLDQRSRAVALSTQIAQEVAAATDLNDLYSRVVNQIKEQFGYYHTQLLRYDPGLDTLALVLGYGEVGQKMRDLNHSLPLGVGLIGQAAATGEPVLRPDLSEEPGWQSNPLLPHTKGELAVPIKLQDKLLGVLDVQSDVVHQLDEDDEILLQGLCGQIAIAIESTNLRQEMEANLRELNSLQQYMRLEGWQDYQATKARVNGYQFDHTGVQPLAEASFLTPPAGDNGNQQPADNGDETAVVPQTAVVTAPLDIRGATIGAIGVLDDLEQPLSEEEQTFLNAITEQVAEALEAARLVEQTQDALAEQERLAAELETVAQVSTAASTILEVDTLLQAVVDLAKSSFNLYHAHVYLVNDTGNTLVLKAGAGNVGRLMTLEGREIHLNAESLVAKAARSHKGIIENDVQKTIDFLPHPLLPNTKSEMAVPMTVGEKVVGVLDLQSDKVGYFTEEDVKIQKTLTSQIAVAIENAKLYAEQVSAAEKLREVDRLKSEFLASMSHELRTPLNSIIGFADVLLEGLDGELNERMEEDVKLIRNSGAHLRELIGDILDMSKIEAGRMELRYETVDIREIAHDIIANANPLAQEKSLNLYMEISDEVDTLQADRTRIRQIMWNIMGNAIKFTETGSVTLNIEEEGENMLISIRDTGIGIAPENVDIVFEQFRQIDGNLNRKAGGTGLGMPITKKLVELHGGDIWVESTLGEGSIFWFTIPLTRTDAAKAGTAPLPELGLN